jgi:catecholate siderophore receptor
MARITRFRLSPISAAVAAVLAGPATAFGQAAAGGEQRLPEVNVTAPQVDTSFKPETTSVGGKGDPQLLRDVPQSVTIINRAVMDSVGAASLPEALRYVPGITLGAAEGGTIGNNINLRGFTARTDVYLDGSRDRGQYYRDVFFLDSIEVLKGPSSMLFGRGSTGGIINQVSKAPLLVNRNEATATVDTNGSLRTTADFNQKLSDTSAVRVAVMAQDWQGTRDVMENKDYGFAPSLRFGIGTPTEVTLSALVLHNRDMPDYGLPPLNGAPAGVPAKTFYGLTDDRTIQDVDTFSARIRHTIEPGFTLRNQTQYSRYDIDVRESGPSSVGTVTGGVYTALPTQGLGNASSLPLSRLFVQLGSHDRQINDTSLYNQTDLTKEFRTGSIKHTMVAGLELGRETYANTAITQALPVVSLLSPAYAPNPGTPFVSGNRASATATTIAPYVNDNIELTKQWKLVGGLRFDRFTAGITNSLPSATTPASGNQTINFTSVRTGAIYQPTETQSYYVAYGTSFDPSLETLTLTNGQGALPPVKNRSYEVGSKWDLLDGRLSLTSALFSIEQQNARSQISPGVYQLTGNVRVNGLELGAAGNITSRWKIIAGYTYLDAKIVQASALDGTQGKVPANTPHGAAALWTTYDFTKEWEIGGGMTHLASRFASNTNVVSVPAYTRFDAMLSYHQPKYDVRLNLYNLTDKQYFDTLIPSDGGRSVPGIGRTALLTYAQRF